MWQEPLQIHTVGREEVKKLKKQDGKFTRFKPSAPRSEMRKQGTEKINQVSNFTAFPTQDR